MAPRCVLMCCRQGRRRIEWKSCASAFMETVKDPELLKEAGKANLEINPGSGEDLERNVKELLRLEPPLVARLKGNSEIGGQNGGFNFYF